MPPARPLRIGFFGLPLGALLLLHDGHAIEWAALSPVDAPGRRRLSARLPNDRLLDLFLVDASWQRTIDAWLAAHPVDLIVSWFFTRRILGRWIDGATHGAVGVHPSLLPKYRGPDPFYAVIDAGEVETGVTLHRLTAEYDDGAILAQRRVAVGQRNAWQLARALDRPSLALLREGVAAFAAGRPPRALEQEPEAVTWALKPADDGLRVDWTWTTERILRRIRALAPIPGLGLALDGTDFIVLAAQSSSECPSALLPGEAYIGQRLALRTGDGAIAVEKACILRDPDDPLVLDGARLADWLRQ